MDPTNVTLAWKSGALYAAYDAPPRSACAVELVETATGAARSVLTPDGEVDTTRIFLVDIAALTDGVSYQARARELPSGAWVTSAPLVLERNPPTAPRLQDLLRSLRGALRDGRLDLTPGVVSAAHLTQLFRDQLGTDTVALTGAAVTSSATDVTVAGDTRVRYSAEDRPVACTLVFTDTTRTELELRVASLGTFTVPKAIDRGLAPAAIHPVSAWGAELTALPNVGMRLSSADGTVRFEGAGSATGWSLPFSLLQVSLGAVRPAMTISAPDRSRPRWHQPDVATALKLGSAEIPVLVTLPAGIEGWRVRLAAEHQLGGFSVFAPLLGGAASGLPKSLDDVGGCRLTALDLEFAAQPKPDFWRLRAGFAVGVAPGGRTPWRALGGLVVLEEVAAQVSATLAGTPCRIVSRSSSARATLVVDGSIRATVGIALPADGTVQLSGSLLVPAVDFAAFAAYLGGDAAPLGAALAKLGTLTGLTVHDVRMVFDPNAVGGSGLQRFGLHVTLASWRITNLSWFALTDLSLELDVERPTAADRVITGHVSGNLAIGPVRLGAAVDFGPTSWSLEATTSADLTSLSQLDPVVPKETVTGFLADVPSTGRFGLARTALVHDTAAGYLASAAFVLEAHAEWPCFNGALVVRDIAVDMTATRSSGSVPWQVTGSLAATAVLGGAVVELAARKAAPTLPWTLSGALAEDYTVDFAAVLRQLSTLAIPGGHGLPTSLVLVALRVEAVPSTGKLDLHGWTRVNWNRSLGQLAFTVEGLGGELHLPGGSGKPTGALNGAFTAGTLRGFATVALTQEITVDVEVDSGATVAALVDGVIGAGTVAAIGTPKGFVQPDGVVSARLTVNLTRNALSLFGRYDGTARYAAVGLVITKDGEQWHHTVAATLANWTPTDISPALSGLDGVIGLTMTRAAVVLSSGAAVSDEIVSRVPALTSGMRLTRGLSFAVEVNTTTGLMKNAAAIAGLAGPYTVAGSIPAEDEAPVVLSASIGTVELVLGKLTLRNVTLAVNRAWHRPGGWSTTISLTGEIIARLDRDHTFKGALVVTDQTAAFHATTAAKVDNPLGIPGLTLDQLGLRLSCRFVNGAATDHQAAFTGTMAFRSGAVLDAQVVLSDGKACLVLLELTRRDGRSLLSLGALFQQVTTSSWDTNACDVALTDGRIWYAPGAVTHEGREYAKGLHAEADVKILFLPLVRLGVGVDGDVLSAHAHFADPIDLTLVKFAHQSGGGPRVAVRTGTPTPFTLESTVEVLGVPCGAVTISAGKNVMRARLTLPAEAGIFAGRPFDFRWDDKGWHIEDWSLKDLRLPKFEFENITGSGECVEKVIFRSIPVDTTFDLKLGLSITVDPAPKVVVTVQGTFDLVVTSRAYADDPLLRADIFTTTFEVPVTRWSELPAALSAGIKKLGQSIVENLLTKPKNLAKLAAIAGVRWVLDEAADYLTCRGMDKKEATKTVRTASSANEGSASAACLAGLGFLGGVGGAAVAFGGVAGGFAGGVFVNQATPPDRNVARPGQPGRPTLAFDTDVLTIGWTAPSPAPAGYAVALDNGAGWAVPLSTVTTTSTTVPLSALPDGETWGHTFTARIFAVGAGGQGDPSEPGTLFMPGPPTDLTLDNTAITLEAAWRPGQGTPVYEEVVTFGRQGEELQPQPGCTIAGTTATIDATALTLDMPYGVRVRSVSPGFRSPWIAAVTTRVPPLLPAGFAPVLTASARELAARLFGQADRDVNLGFGTFDAASGALATTPDAGYHKIGLRMAGAAAIPARVVIMCCDVPLRQAIWFADGVPAGSLGVWTSLGWQGFDIGDAEPFDGRYFYRLDVAERQVGAEVMLYLESWPAAATVAFLLPGGAEPLPGGFAPVLAHDGRTLVNRVLGVYATGSTVGTGTVVAGGAVTTVPVENMHKVVLALGSSRHRVGTEVVVASTTRLTYRFGWFNSDLGGAGLNSAWTASGWNERVPWETSEDWLARAVPVGGRYFYRVRLSDVVCGGPMVCYVQSTTPATLTFFTRPRDTPVAALAPVSRTTSTTTALARTTTGTRQLRLSVEKWAPTGPPDYVVGLRTYLVDSGRLVDEVVLGNGHARWATVVARGRYAFLAVEDLAWHVVDLGTAARVIASVTRPGVDVATGVAVRGDLVFTTGSLSGLTVYRFAPASTQPLTELGRFHGHASGVALRGAYAFVVNRITHGGFTVVDVSRPDAPLLVHRHDNQFVADDIAITGHHAVLTGPAGVSVVDIANPAHPVDVATAPTDVSGIRRTVTTHADVVVVTGSDGTATFRLHSPETRP